MNVQSWQPGNGSPEVKVTESATPQSQIWHSQRGARPKPNSRVGPALLEQQPQGSLHRVEPRHSPGAAQRGGRGLGGGPGRVRSGRRVVRFRGFAVWSGSVWPRV